MKITPKIMVQDMSAKGGKIIVGNLKANLLSPQERDRFLSALKKMLSGKQLNKAEIAVCPPFVHLESFIRSLKGTAFGVGAQDVFGEEKGSFTGEVTAPMLKNLGVSLVIVGHSERRKYTLESNEAINRKIKSLLKNNLLPVLCVGETEIERADGKMKEVIQCQILGALGDIPANRLERIMIAYEPVWAVGTDIFPSSDEVMEARILIKKLLAEKYGLKKAELVRILYGGSVNPRMTKQVCLDPGMDGVLVGRASLVPSEFIKIAEIINNA